MNTTAANPSESADLEERASTTKPSDVKDQVSVLGEDVRELARLAREAARDELARALERGNETASRVKERAREKEDALVESVREQPLRSLAYAAGAGLALGLFLRR